MFKHMIIEYFCLFDREENTNPSAPTFCRYGPSKVGMHCIFANRYLDFTDEDSINDKDNRHSLIGKDEALCPFVYITVANNSS